MKSKDEIYAATVKSSTAFTLITLLSIAVLAIILL